MYQAKRSTLQDDRWFVLMDGTPRPIAFFAGPTAQADAEHFARWKNVRQGVILLDTEVTPPGPIL
jgi:hypothetical protein